MKFEQTAQCPDEVRLDTLYDEIGENIDRLPLGPFCRRGGWPVAVKLATIAVIEDSARKLEVVLYVDFTESGSDCCSGDRFSCERHAELALRIDKSDWQGEIAPLENA